MVCICQQMLRPLYTPCEGEGTLRVFARRHIAPCTKPILLDSLQQGAQSKKDNLKENALKKECCHKHLIHGLIKHTYNVKTIRNDLIFYYFF